MRFLKSFFLMVLASAFLVACGGGGSDLVTGGGSGGSSDLYAAYDKINGGMNYEQVKAVVGYAHNAGEDNFSSINGKITYKWGSGSSAILAVTIHNATGATAKIIAGTTGNKSQTF